MPVDVMGQVLCCPRKIGGRNIDKRLTRTLFTFFFTTFHLSLFSFPLTTTQFLTSLLLITTYITTPWVKNALS